MNRFLRFRQRFRPSGKGALLASLFFGLLPVAAWAEPLRVVAVSDVARDRESSTGANALLNHLERAYAISLDVVFIGEQDLDLAPLTGADVIFFYVEEAIPERHRAALRSHVEGPRPLVALRGAAQAFGEGAGVDEAVFGARFDGISESGFTTRTRLNQEAAEHPVFDGVEPLRSRHALYRFGPLATDAQALKVGMVPGEALQTIAWTRQQGDRRIFYSSIGGPLDFENDGFKRMIGNAIYWVVDRAPQRKPLADPEWVARGQQDIVVPLRSRGAAENGDAPQVATKDETVPLDVAALLVVDVFDTHWCPCAAERMEALAVRVNELVSAARKAGMMIVHVPSQTEGFYEEHPARRRVERIAGVTVEGNYPIVAEAMRSLDFPPFPLSNSDCPDGSRPYQAWTRQHPAIEIHQNDVMSSIGHQLYSYLITQGVDTVFYVGTHANLGLIDRTFGMRQMYEWGMQPVLVRDLTDIVYDPGTPPEMSHEAALQTAIEHIEAHLAPTVSIGEFLEALGRIGSE